MAENSAISWTDDTFNPWEGCQKVGPGCDGCYAEARNARYAPAGVTVAPNWGPGAPRRRTSPQNWKKPLKWDREVAANPGAWPRGRFVFCASLADWADNAVPIQWLADLLKLISKTPRLTWLMLTKRIGIAAKRVAEALKLAGLAAWPNNAALGITVVNQEEADRDIPKLLTVALALGVAFTFLSMEPLLGPVDISPYLYEVLAEDGESPRDAIDFVTTGGETDQGGHKARRPDGAWFRSIRDQCAHAGVPFDFKQWGASVRPDPKTLDGVAHHDRPALA